MDEYTQSVDLKFISNIDDIVDQVKDLKKFSENMKANFTPSGTSSMELEEETSNAVFEFSKAVNDWVRSTEGVSELINVQLPTSWAGMVTGIAKGLLNVFRKAWDELNEMISYNYLSDSNVRKLRLTYGLDAGEAYSYSKVADIMGISSLEDFSFMDDNQLALFQETAQEFMDIYSEYATDGDLTNGIYQFNIEMEKLKVEALKPMLEAINQNKESIITFINNLPEYLSSLISLLTNLLQWLGEYEDRKTTRKEAENMKDQIIEESYNPDATLSTKFAALALNSQSFWGSKISSFLTPYISKLFGTKSMSNNTNSTENNTENNNYSTENNDYSNTEYLTNNNSTLDLSGLYSVDATMNIGDTNIDITLENIVDGKKVSSKKYSDTVPSGQNYASTRQSYGVTS